MSSNKSRSFSGTSTINPSIVGLGFVSIVISAALINFSARFDKDAGDELVKTFYGLRPGNLTAGTGGGPDSIDIFLQEEGHVNVWAYVVTASVLVAVHHLLLLIHEISDIKSPEYSYVLYIAAASTHALTNTLLWGLGFSINVSDFVTTLLLSLVSMYLIARAVPEETRGGYSRLNDEPKKSTGLKTSLDAYTKLAKFFYIGTAFGLECWVIRLPALLNIWQVFTRQESFFYGAVILDYVWTVVQFLVISESFTQCCYSVAQNRQKSSNFFWFVVLDCVRFLWLIIIILYL